MRVRALIFLLGLLGATATGAIPLDEIDGSAARERVSPSQCNPAGSLAIATLEGMTVIWLPREKGSVIYGCLLPGGQIQPLGRGGTDPRIELSPFSLDLRTLVGNPPWVAYVKFFLVGVDTLHSYVVAKNLRTGAVKRCRVGHRENGYGPEPVAFVLKANGSIAWTRENPEALIDHQRAMGACDSVGQAILDAGETLDVHSLALRGSLLTWSNGGVARSARLN